MGGYLCVVRVESDQLRAEGRAGVGRHETEEAPCSATGTMTRVGCTTLPLEKAASALSMAGITSSMRSKRPTAFSSRFIPRLSCTRFRPDHVALAA